jgi:hypothetical protein
MQQTTLLRLEQQLLAGSVCFRGRVWSGGGGQS